MLMSNKKIIISICVLVIAMMSLLSFTLIACDSNKDNKTEQLEENIVMAAAGKELAPGTKQNPLTGPDGKYEVKIKDMKPMGPFAPKIFEDFIILDKKGADYTFSLMQKSTDNMMSKFKCKIGGKAVDAEVVNDGKRLIHKFNMKEADLKKPLHFDAFVTAMKKEVHFDIEFVFDEAIVRASDFEEGLEGSFVFPMWGYFVIAGVVVVVIIAAIVVPIVVVKSKKKKAIANVSTDNAENSDEENK